MLIDGRPRETHRVWITALLLGLLIGANNLIKILRDSVFLGHHSVSELPYLYIMVAVLAGVIIGTYTRYTANISITRLILSTNAIILSNLVFFWIVLTYFNADWSHYAFYIWSAMATVIAVAQAWTLANSILLPRRAKDLLVLSRPEGPWAEWQLVSELIGQFISPSRAIICSGLSRGSIWPRLC
jgi:ATP/ADP translocase